MPQCQHDYPEDYPAKTEYIHGSSAHVELTQPREGNRWEEIKKNSKKTCSFESAMALPRVFFVGHLSQFNAVGQRG